MTVHQLPASLRWAVWLLGVEAGVAGVIAVWLAYQGFAGAAAAVGDALAVAGFVLLIAASLAGLSLALARRKPRARAPAIVFQLLLVMFAYVLLSSGLPLLGLPLGVLALTTGTLLFAPPTGQALAGAASR